MTAGSAAWAQESEQPSRPKREGDRGPSGPMWWPLPEPCRRTNIYHPIADQWTFGKIVAHVIQANDHGCAMLTEKPAPTDVVTDTTPKDKLVPALQASVDIATQRLTS